MKTAESSECRRASEHEAIRAISEFRVEFKKEKKEMGKL